MIKIQNLKKQYKDICIEGTLEVKKGYITGLIGENGAGKSTIFKMILNLVFPDSGSGTVFSKDVTKLTKEEKEKIGVVFAESGFSNLFTIQDIIPILKGFYPNFQQEFFLKQCDKFRLPKNKKLKEFSTGMKTKLKVLVAISHKASLLILDEPTIGLDVATRMEVLELLREFMEEDEERSIFISSHNASDLESLCDDFYVIHQGKIILHEETDVLLSEYAILKVTEEQMKQIDLQYIISKKKEPYGYQCLTDQKQFYMENYKELIIEKSGIDEMLYQIISDPSAKVKR